MGRCKDCVHWAGEGREFRYEQAASRRGGSPEFTEVTVPVGGRLGECNDWRLGSADGEAADVLVIMAGDEAVTTEATMTGANFGCVHWEGAA